MIRFDDIHPSAPFIALNFLPLSPLRKARLLSDSSSPKEAAMEALNLFGTDEQAGIHRKIDAEIRLAERENIRLLTPLDPAWPALLKEIPDPPPVLYLRGNLPAAASVAVVGSRKPTAWGLRNAEKFARGLAEDEISIVSGLAHGIDAAAHRGALAARRDSASVGVTVAVIGSGLRHLYPRENQRLADSIIDSGGGILSEFPLETRPARENFPRRNRVIAGLSLGVLVVEAALKSGSLITARLAGEYNRLVWALPDRPDNPLSEGVLALIRDGVTAARGADDILEDIRPLLSRRESRKRKKEIEEPTTDEVIEALGADGATMDELMAVTGRGREELAKRLLWHELAGRVTVMPGGLFRRTG